MRPRLAFLLRDVAFSECWWRRLDDATFFLGEGSPVVNSSKRVFPLYWRTNCTDMDLRQGLILKVLLTVVYNFRSSMYAGKGDGGGCWGRLS